MECGIRLIKSRTSCLIPRYLPFFEEVVLAFLLPDLLVDLAALLLAALVSFALVEVFFLAEVARAFFALLLLDFDLLFAAELFVVLVKAVVLFVARGFLVLAAKAELLERLFEPEMERAGPGAAEQTALAWWLSLNDCPSCSKTPEEVPLVKAERKEVA
jgi:hypothetical protein